MWKLKPLCKEKPLPSLTQRHATPLTHPSFLYSLLPSLFPFLCLHPFPSPILTSSVFPPSSACHSSLLGLEWEKLLLLSPCLELDLPGHEIILGYLWVEEWSPQEHSKCRREIKSVFSLCWSGFSRGTELIGLIYLSVCWSVRLKGDLLEWLTGCGPASSTMTYQQKVQVSILVRSTMLDVLMGFQALMPVKDWSFWWEPEQAGKESKLHSSVSHR